MEGQAIFPPGYRFCPNDDEVLYYLSKKNNDPSRYTTYLVKEVDLYDFHPEELREIYGATGDEFSYFFTMMKRRSPQGNRCQRVAKGGYWKATCGDQPCSRKHVAVKKSLDFYDGKPGHSKKSNWIMHDFRITKIEPTTEAMDQYVLCRIYKRAARKALCNEEEVNEVVQGQPMEREWEARRGPTGEEIISKEDGISWEQEISNCNQPHNGEEFHEVVGQQMEGEPEAKRGPAQEKIISIEDDEFWEQLSSYFY